MNQTQQQILDKYQQRYPDAKFHPPLIVERFARKFGRELGSILSDESKPASPVQRINPTTGGEYTYARNPIAFSFSTGGASYARIIRSAEDEKMALENALAQMDVRDGKLSPGEYWDYCLEHFFGRGALSLSKRSKIVYQITPWGA